MPGKGYKEPKSSWRKSQSLIAKIKKDWIQELKIQLKEAYSKKELFWSQKSRIQWLKEGDKNIHFFHSSVKGRRRRHKMQRILRKDKSWANTKEEIGEEVEKYFKNLFCSMGVDHFDVILERIPHTITNQVNTNLMKPVDEKETTKALFAMNPNESLGPDGMTPMFFQKFWHIVKLKIIKSIRSFFILVSCGEL